ncbi:sulfurtransferase [Nocardia sp. NPDC004711]
MDWLAEHLDDPDLLVLDATMWLRQGDDGSVYYDSGRDSWAGGHIPNAGFADLIDELSAPGSQFLYTVPDVERFTAGISRLGVGTGTHVVAYDAESGMWATRLWWLLRLFGVDTVSVLDGGLTAWNSAGLGLSTDTTPRPSASFTAVFRPEWLATTAQVHQLLGNHEANLVSALPEFIFRGDGPQIAARRGHIPGSASVPALDLIDPVTNRFRSIPQLQTRFEEAGVISDRPTVAYCGGGIAATLNAFALTLLGYRNIAVYDGSLAEWAAAVPELPVELG